MSRCPKCKTVDLKTAGPGGTPVLRCYRCHGMWVTIDEARELLTRGAIADPPSMLPQTVGNDDMGGLCPDGHGILSRARVDGPEPFYLERCTRCSGIWFDSGEWAQLASLHLVNHLGDLWDPDRRRQLVEQRLESGHRARMVALVGAELVDRIDRLVSDIDQHPSVREAKGYLMQKLGR